MYALQDFLKNQCMNCDNLSTDPAAAQFLLICGLFWMNLKQFLASLEREGFYLSTDYAPLCVLLYLLFVVLLVELSLLL